MSHQPSWADFEPLDEVTCREIEEQVDQRMKAKALRDCELPPEFRLVKPIPRQFWMDGQLVWAFCLAWAPVDRKGVRGKDVYFHVERYDWRIADDLQMGWALDEFVAALRAAGERPQVEKEHEERKARVLVM